MWLSWSTDGGLTGFDLARNPGSSNTTEYGAGELPLSTRQATWTSAQSTSKPSSIIRSQQTEEANPHISKLIGESDKARKERIRLVLKSTKPYLKGTC